MVYEVVTWVYDNPMAKSNFDKVEAVTDAIKQAIVNDIRKNGYLFDAISGASPVLNSGEMVSLSFDFDLCEELMCQAYDFDVEQYRQYSDKICNVPDTEINGPDEPIKIENNLKSIVWVKDDAFSALKDALLNGNSNAEMIPCTHIFLKKGDVVVWKREDESDSFELQVKAFLPGTVTKLSDIKKMEKTDTQSIVRLVCPQNGFESEEPLLYRNENRSGEEIYNDFKDNYGTWLLSFLTANSFDCSIDMIVFDKNMSFERPVLEMPDDRKLSDDVWKKIHDSYTELQKEEEALQRKRNETYLKLKEKVKAKKKASEEEEEVKKMDETNETNEMSEMNADKIPFITLDNIGDYFNKNEEESIESLIEKATKEYNLAKSNQVPEKSLMLLNNACIYFYKIRQKGGAVPSELFFNVNSELIKTMRACDPHEIVPDVIDEIDAHYQALTEAEQNHYVIPYCKILLQYIFYLNDNDDFSTLIKYVDLVLDLLDENECDEALYIQSNCFSVLSSLYFEAKLYDEAINYGYNALMTMKEIQDKTPAVYNQYATFAFNLGNIYFQSDKYENAITMFTFTIGFCKENEFKDNFVILHYASNYLSQVYVCQKEYDRAIQGYSDYIAYSNAHFSGDRATKVVADFLYRIAFIYKKFLNDTETAKQYIDQAKTAISGLEDQTDEEVAELMDRLHQLQS